VRRLGSEAGQGSVELVAIAPVLVLVGLVLAQGVLAVRAQLVGERALARARVAIAQGEDPAAAARAGLPEGSRVVRSAHALRVHVALALPQLPGMPGEVVAATSLEP